MTLYATINQTSGSAMDSKNDAGEESTDEDHEPIVPIVGAVLGGIALIIAIIAFKKTLDFQAYRELDSNYMDILKEGLDNTYLRNPEITTNYLNLKEEDIKLKYETYAYLVWNFCETIYDRKKIDKTWLPVIEEEKRLHFKWLMDEKNRHRFKDEFIKFVEQNNIPIRKGILPKLS